MGGAERNPPSTEHKQIDSVSLMSWGANSYGQLGQGHKEDQLVPEEATKSSLSCIPTPRIITGGGGHTLIVTANGSLWVGGSNCHGQLGLGHREDIGVLAELTHPFGSRITHVAGGWDFTVACTEDGSLYTWGSNAFSQLGRLTPEKWSGIPGKIDLPAGSSVTCVAAGLRHALALTEEGWVFAWGQNKKGQAGHIAGEGGEALRVVPLPHKLNLPSKGKVLQLIAGAYHSAVLTDCQEVCLWGCNKCGQLSQDPGSLSHSAQPLCLSTSQFSGEPVTHIVCGWTHNLALTETGKVYSWGRGDYGQLGRSCDGSCDHVPKPVAGVGGVRRLVCGSEHCLALSENGKLLCWGWNEHGMCGTGDESNVPLPVQVALPGKQTLSIGCGAGHSFALVSR